MKQKQQNIIASFPWLAQLLSYVIQVHLCRGGTAQSELVPLTLINNQEKNPTDLSIGN